MKVESKTKWILKSTDGWVNQENKKKILKYTEKYLSKRKNNNKVKCGEWKT